MHGRPGDEVRPLAAVEQSHLAEDANWGDNGQVRTLLNAVLNVVWLVLAGFWLAILYLFGGFVMCALIITIPFGVAAFRLGFFVLWPFGRVLVRRPDAGTASMIGNILWFVLFGWEIALGHLFTGLLLCLTIIGIPLGLGSLKLALVAVAPLGKEIVPTSDPRAAYGAVSF